MSPKSSPKAKKKELLTKKAPGAPKRFKSSYILFFMHVQTEIKKKLPPGTHTAPVVSKKASELWRNLSAEKRLHWDNEAAKEKQRYILEKESYTGPWQVPHIRAKKDPSAPRRNPSAFLLYSVKKRKEIKKLNPELKTTDISRMLGRLWRETSNEEKRPFVEREEIERFEYKEKMEAWKKDKECRDREEAQKAKVKQKEADETEAKDAKKRSDDLANATFGPDIVDVEELSSPREEGTPNRHTTISPRIDYRPTETNRIPEASHSGGDWWKWNSGDVPEPQRQRSSEHYLYSPQRHQYNPLRYNTSAPPPQQHQHHNHHPCRIESHPTSRQQTYSPIPLFNRNDQEPMFCPSPIIRQPETLQFHHSAPARCSAPQPAPAPDDVQSRTTWVPPIPPTQNYRSHSRPGNGDRASIATAFSRAEQQAETTPEPFDRYGQNQLFIDSELDCSPIGSYDEFDPQFDPVSIH